MDYEYADDIDDSEVAHFEKIIKEYSFTDEDVRDVFRVLASGEEPVRPHDMFAFTFRDSEIVDTRITRVCKSMANQIFIIHFLDGNRFVIRLNTKHSYETELAIINAAAGAGIEVPRSYFSHSDGIVIGKHTYYAMLQEYVPGIDFETAARNGLITTGDKEVLLEMMGERLKRIHAITSIDGVQQADTQSHYFSDAIDQLDGERDSIFDQQISSKEEFEELYEKVDSLRDAAEMFNDQYFGLAHGDYHPKHVLLDLSGARPRISAIIDWGDATFTNTYFDFALWDFWCGEEFLADSLMEAYGIESFTSSESKVNVELTTIAALIQTLCAYAHRPDFKATQLGVWQRLLHEVREATY